MKIAIVLGTRPEIVKFSSIIKFCENNKLNYFILHTNQHYSFEMDKIFFNDLNLPEPTFNLDVGSGTHGYQTGKMLEGIEKILLKERPDATLVLGDTNTTLAGALASAKLHIKIAHVESGMRSFNKKMPEEINRIVADHCSDFLFCPTRTAKRNLLNEGIDKSRIYLVGDTLVDAILDYVKIAKKHSNILHEVNLIPKKYFLITVHRAENVDVKKNLVKIILTLRKLSDTYNIPIIFPMHPRTRTRIYEFGLEKRLQNENLKVIHPVGYFDLLMLEKNALVVLTDSGGVQEECCILKTPCVTLRNETEWEETIRIKANILAGISEKRVVKSIEKILKVMTSWENPLGDGKSGERIVKILWRKLN